MEVWNFILQPSAFIPPKTPMKPEHRRELTDAGRHHLALALRALELATRSFAESAQNGTKSDLLRASRQWDETVANAQDAKRQSLEFLGDEVEAWLKQ